MPGRSDCAKIGFLVEAIVVGTERGDSRIETAAVEYEAVEEVPRTITWRWVDLSAW
jgi:hypothetical protein